MACGLFLFAGCNTQAETQKSLIEKWITAERYSGLSNREAYQVFYNRWYDKIFDGLIIRAKLKEPLESRGDDKKLDFAYEVTAAITAPKIYQGKGKDILGYTIKLEFRLFDDDGFIIYKICPEDYSNVRHSVYLDDELSFHVSEYATEGETKIMRLLQNAVPESIAKKTVKITYAPGIVPIK